MIGPQFKCGGSQEQGSPICRSSAPVGSHRAEDCSFSFSRRGKISRHWRHFFERRQRTLLAAGSVDDRVTPELLGRLLDEHGGALGLYAAPWTESADDCVQEALIELAALQRLPASPAAWLYRVVRNRAISHFRSTRGRERREQLALRLRPPVSREGDRPRRAIDPDSEQLAAALAALNDEIREIVVARIWGQLNFEQIAELAGCSTSTAHRRYEAGLAALRERLSLPCPTNAKAPTGVRAR